MSQTKPLKIVGQFKKVFTLGGNKPRLILTKDFICLPISLILSFIIKIVRQNKILNLIRIYISDSTHV